MIRIAVPATTANFGSGFDCLGAALDCYNIIEMEERDGCFIEILDDTSVPVNEENLIYTTARELYRRCGREFGGCTSGSGTASPPPGGWGSSSACIAGGLLGANELMGRPCPLQHLVDIAAELEGHRTIPLRRCWEALWPLPWTVGGSITAGANSLPSWHFWRRCLILN